MSYYLTDLADACRKSGLKVVEVSGWKSRGHGGMASVQTIVCHHTATSDKASGDYPSMRVVRDGRPGLPGPLAQLGLGRDGTVYVIAAGRCYHAGTTWYKRQTNSNAIGIECEASGARAIEGVQLTAYHKLVKALADHYGVPVSHVESHAEIAKPRGRKTDVRNAMNGFRAAVAAVGASAPLPVKTGGKYLTITGTLNEGTVKVLQKYLGVAVDGSLGPKTISALQVLTKAPGKADGVFGPRSARALETFLGATPATVGGWYPGLIRSLQRHLNDQIKAGKL